MTHVDRSLLERLQNEGADELVLGPRPIADNTDFARSTVRTHLLELRDHNMVEYYDEEGGVYQLTDRGRAFLAGDEDPAGNDYDDP
ncbi:ArsR family transcriptional regulator [Halorubellus sp. PRR65]|uniref:ArsR family transcriptional regulator n=1 Tax=Halorubellus sp. PRR65 TaxID=3098148 RepID=UPI002B25884D|nr:ArsR family transcriptional regulator [Halorubellus sp. PRR65]